MYKIYFYKDRSGNVPVLDYIRTLSKKSDKSNRIKLKKIQDYMNALREYGLQLQEPYVKHIEGKIWELRPAQDRILFVVWYNESFVFLHPFRKRTRKTPVKEIEKAKREFAEFVERRT